MDAMTNTRQHTLGPAALTGLIESIFAIIDDLEPVGVFQRIVDNAAAILHAESACLLLFDPDRHELIFETSIGPSGSMRHGQRVDAAAGLAGEALRTRRAVAAEDARDQTTAFAGAQGTRSLAAAPVLHGNTIVGVIEILDPRQGDTFTSEDLELLRVFARMAAAPIRHAWTIDRLHRETSGLRQSSRTPDIIGDSPVLADAMDLCGKVAPASAHVMIRGEIGTGKQLMARFIHASSTRRDRPFVAVNCAEIPQSMLEAELFGTERRDLGSHHMGHLEVADGGTLLLTNVSAMSPAVQAKLLRVLQDHEFIRVGGIQSVRANVRVIATTSIDLPAAVRRREFREDLYYRLNVFPIELPPLRQRGDDVVLIAEYLVGQLAFEMHRSAPRISSAAAECLRRYEWPGNVRELRAVIDRCVLLADDEITPADLPLSGGHDVTSVEGVQSSRLVDQERGMILDALTRHQWNQTAAARELGVSRDHIRYRIRKYGLRPTG